MLCWRLKEERNTFNLETSLYTKLYIRGEERKLGTAWLNVQCPLK